MKWSKLEPSEFYFYTGPVKDDYERQLGINSWTIICPKVFFQDNGFVPDQYLNIGIHIPESMSEEGASLFSSTNSIEETKQDLLNKGFNQNDLFSKFCSEYDPFV